MFCVLDLESPEGAFEDMFWVECEFRAFGLKNLERVLRKMFWFGT